ncbi:MAG: DHH family phosphoesterase, partial [Lachnospiraceae bacterium]|nr:DHH family phosphoesterase [Lachnospiraceae bacterium]
MMQFEKELQGIRTVAIAGHIRPDGDCVGACIGLWHYIRENFEQIQADIFLENPDEKFAVLEGFDKIRQAEEEDRDYDCFIALDCAVCERLGAAAGYFDRAGKTICVDHHVSNSGFADVQVIDPDASSTCEVLCRMTDAYTHLGAQQL